MKPKELLIIVSEKNIFNRVVRQSVDIKLKGKDGRVRINLLIL